LHAATGVANSGPWESVSTWNFNGVNRLPNCGDSLIIPNALTVTVNSNIDLSNCGQPIYISLGGKLDFNLGYSMKLSCFSTIEVFSGAQIKRTGVGHDNTFIDICNTILYRGSTGNFNGYANLTAGSFLPVSLLSFTADAETEGVNIVWTTASENNNDYYTIERSVDGVKFISLTNVHGSGTTSVLHKYSWVI
jgi:hypothetical protein